MLEDLGQVRSGAVRRWSHLEHLQWGEDCGIGLLSQGSGSGLTITTLVWFCTGLVRGQPGSHKVHMIPLPQPPFLCVVSPQGRASQHLLARLHDLGVVWRVPASGMVVAIHPPTLSLPIT